MAERLFRFLAWGLLIVFAYCVLAFFATILTGMLENLIATLYAKFPEDPSKRYQTFSQLIGALIALFSLFVAVLTIWVSGRQNRKASRKQYTVTILLETRLSSEFRETLEKRRAVFPEYQDITFDSWNDARLAKPASASPADIEAAAVKTRGAQALASLLNYYEFLAIGIENGDLDEAMLKQSVRGIMCNLVDDSRLVISTMQKKNSKTYEHLALLYDRWRLQNAHDINGNPNERPIPKA